MGPSIVDLKEILPMSRFNLGSTRDLPLLRLWCRLALLKRFFYFIWSDVVIYFVH